MTTVTDQLVARAAELDSLDTAIAGLERGGPAALVLLVELGIRQTSLLGEFAARADALGHIVLSGRASEVEGDLPFWLFVDALDEFVAGVDPCRLESLGDDLLTELARSFPRYRISPAPVSRRCRGTFVIRSTTASTENAAPYGDALRGAPA
jgi:hypothetical protein